MKLKNGRITFEADEGWTVGELIEKLEEEFPNGKWADFKIEFKESSVPNMYKIEDRIINVLPDYSDNPELEKYMMLTNAEGVVNVTSRDIPKVWETSATS